MLTTLDHFMYAGTSLDDMATGFTALTGIVPEQGGRHPTLGTHNCLVGAGSSTYLELIAPDPASDVRSPMRDGMEALPRPQLHRFIMRCASADFPALAEAYRRSGIEAPVHDLERLTQDGQILRWRLMIPEANSYGLFAPLFIDWLDTPHPTGRLTPDATVLACEAGHPQADRLALLWRDLGVEIPLRAADAPYMHVRLGTPRGEVAMTSGFL
ncbi:VOC family protein [Castellaniella sp. GW247-6E4]|uniref:VOC family protein n=1 Tax=Castellaniella sp. GW247-6E4 TaxID=3140380 RepID=UPI003315B1DC